MHPLLAEARRLGLHPKRSLGQNFLFDDSHLDRIAQAAELARDDTVLEIGPGLGTLTTRLLQQAGRVVAVELDERLIAFLEKQLAAYANLQIVHGDILELDPAQLMHEAGVDLTPALAASPGGSDAPRPDAGSYAAQNDAVQNYTARYKVVANLPYYITSAVLRHLLEASARPARIVVLVQKEVAERICAAPGDLSLLAVSVQFYARPQIVQRVPAGAFYPPPKVDSAVLRLDVLPRPAIYAQPDTGMLDPETAPPETAPPDTGASSRITPAPVSPVQVSPAHYFRVVRAGFGQKRKQLANSLSANLALPKPQVIAALETAHIDPRRRAETLSLYEWAELSRLV